MEALLISINKRTFVVCERDERVDEGRGRNAAGRSGRGEAVSRGDHPQDHEGDRRPGQVQEDLRQGICCRCCHCIVGNINIISQICIINCYV